MTFFPQSKKPSKIIQSDQHNQHMSKIHLVHFVHFLQFSNPQQNDPTDLNSENRCIINNHMIKNRLNFEILNSKKNSNIGTKFPEKMGTFLIQF